MTLDRLLCVAAAARLESASRSEKCADNRRHKNAVPGDRGRADAAANSLRDLQVPRPARCCMRAIKAEAAEPSSCHAACVATSPDPCLAITTIQCPLTIDLMRAVLNHSRTMRLIRFLITDFPIFLETVIPNRAGDASSSDLKR